MVMSSSTRVQTALLLWSLSTWCCVMLVPAVNANFLQSLMKKLPADAFLTTPQLINKYGYSSEVHHVTTSDGYILEVHRIPHGKHAVSKVHKPAVLVMHGLLCSSADWVVTGTSNGLGYILADLGYDVWLGNSRGNRYSRRHVTADPDIHGGVYWDFSWHEMGMHDLPAVIDHILAATGLPDLFYIGYSQGSTQFYVMASERPEYNAKVRAMFSLAPVAYMSHVRNPQYRVIAAADRKSKGLITTLGAREFLPHNIVKALLGYLLCKDDLLRQIICEKNLYKSVGINSRHIDRDVVPLLLAHTPAGSSTKQVFHFAQGVNSAKFSQYNYGEQENIKRYGNETPPAYNLSRITCPVSLHYSVNDYLSATKDVDILYSELPNPIGKFLVQRSDFNHVDFLSARDIKELLYDHVTDLMATFLVNKT